MNDFFKELDKSIYKNIAIDFDGVIHKSSKGYHDGTVYDEPVEGALEGLKRLSEKFDLIIFTCKADNNRPLVNGKTGTELIWEWLRKYKMDKYIIDVTDKKPRAKYYIDDKGITFFSWEQILNKLF